MRKIIRRLIIFFVAALVITGISLAVFTIFFDQAVLVRKGPPKAWLSSEEKKKINAMGYRIILWTLNSKDWVTFDDKYIVK